MKGKKKKKKEEKISPHLLLSKGVVILSCTFFLLLCFLSFHHKDYHENWLGITGYIFAWLFHYLFGIASYLILAFSMWIAISYLCNKPITHFKIKVFHFSLFLTCTCLLLNLFSEVYPLENAVIKAHIYSEEFFLHIPFSHRFVRYNLGGVPFYYLFRDLPLFNLQKLLSNIGVAITFSLIGLVSLILLTEMRILFTFKNFFLGIISFFKWTPTIFRVFYPQKRTTLKKTTPPLFSSEIIQKQHSSFRVKPYKTPIKATSPLNPLIASSDNKIKEAVKEKPSLISHAGASLKEEPKKPHKSFEFLEKKYEGEYLAYHLPSENLVSEARKLDAPTLHRDLQKQAEILEETLLSFGIEAKVGEIYSGPTITSFEVHPAVGVKVQKIKALSNDIALNLQAKSIRIIAPIPGKAAVGVEIPSLYPQEVGFREMLTDYQRSKTKFSIPILLGKTVSGENVMCDLTRMPHCIIAGATGSGKSVCINTIIMSMVMNARPDEIKLILIDPKKVELTPYSRLPHMVAPVITEATGAYASLNWLVKEMQVRYDILKQLGLRNIQAFNHRKRDEELENSLKIEVPKRMFYIVCIIDEFADLMMTSSTDLETPIARIAQMARAVGIHLILATQRPSREVITGLIKANFPTRISFKVSSRVNSQIILDENGAESLLGNGDMLFLPPGSHQLIRAQGVYIRDDDINRITDHICSQASPNYLIKSFDTLEKEDILFFSQEEEAPKDSLYEKALEIVLETRNASTTFLQRKLKIGYARAASLMDELEERGIIGPQEGSRPRKILATSDSYHHMDEEEDE